jgi:hypothetical protein
MRIRLALACCLLLSSPTLAQNKPGPQGQSAGGSPPAAPQAAPEVEAMGAKLMQEINASISCSAGMVSARREIERLQALVKELEAKPAVAADKPEK